jgi:uncharacterized protein
MEAGLPYMFGCIRFSSLRRDTDPEFSSYFHYRGVGDTRLAEPGSLEFFLVERYLLFSTKRSRIRYGRVHHPPYPIMDADVVQWDANLFHINGFNIPGRPPDHTVYSAASDVNIYFLEK